MRNSPISSSLRPTPSREVRSHPASPAAYILTSQVLWGLTLLLLAGVVFLVSVSRIEVQGTYPPMKLLTLIAFGAAALFYTYVRLDLRLASLCDTIALTSVFTIVGAAYSYIMTSLGSGEPFWDDRLMAADRALGFDWHACLTWLNGHPLLGWGLNAIYGYLPVQLTLLIFCLIGLEQYGRLQGLVLATQIWVLVGGAVPAVVPALGPYRQLGIDPALDHPAIPLTVMNAHVATVTELRGPAPVLQPDVLTGIITFPSFHMAVAVLFTWGFWRVPVLRWVALILNAIMVVSTPLSGSHYLVDLIAGGLLAVLSIVTASALQRAIRRRVARRASLADDPREAIPVSGGVLHA